MKGPRGRRLLYALAAFVAFLFAAFFWVRNRARRPVGVVAEAPREEASPVAPVHTMAPAPSIASSAAPAKQAAPENDRDAFLARMAETRKTLLEKTRYPIGSQPLALKTDLLQPHHVEPTLRGLNGDPSKSHDVLIAQNQDRVWVTPGQPAIATITATKNGQPAVLTIGRSELTPQIDDPSGRSHAGATVGTPVFLDDGVPPDALAGDGTYTAAVTFPASMPAGPVVLTVDAQAEGEQGTLLFNFVETAAAPATFTQTARDALEDGSIAIYVGIQVQQAGTYEVVGRLYDSTGLPLVYMRFIGPLTPASTEVRLLAFGKVILDEGGVPPFQLEDVEGNEMLIGQYPDRAPMADWPGPYATGNYALSQLSSADYDGPDKQRKLSALDQATQEGLQNIQASSSAQGAGAAAH